MRRILALLLFATLAACVHQPPTISTTVENFSNLPADYVGKKVVVVGYPQEIADSLGWQKNKLIFEKQFANQGLIISDLEHADFAALVTYAVSDPNVTTKVASEPIYGVTGGGTTYTSGSVSSMSGGFGTYTGSQYSFPEYGVVGSQTYSYDVTSYTRQVAITMLARGTKQRVFESTASSTGRCAVIGEVLGEMTEAIFSKFPSGTGTVTVLTTEKNC